MLNEMRASREKDQTLYKLIRFLKIRVQCNAQQFLQLVSLAPGTEGARLPGCLHILFLLLFDLLTLPGATQGKATL